MKKEYPMTASQEATAKRKGWIKLKPGAGWKKPKGFTDHDQHRIDQASARRARRQRGAD